MPFLLGAGAVLVAALVLATVHRALTAADRGEIHQHEPELDDLDRAERAEAVQIGAGLGNES